MSDRERFEKYLRALTAGYYNFSAESNGEYSDGEVQEAWELWQAALAERDAHQWISVQERLPEKECDVLVLTGRSRYVYVARLAGPDRACQHAWSLEKPMVEGQESRFKKRLCLEASDVTHWMPLPAPPKVEAEKLLKGEG